MQKFFFVQEKRTTHPSRNATFWEEKKKDHGYQEQPPKCNFHHRVDNDELSTAISGCMGNPPVKGTAGGTYLSKCPASRYCLLTVGSRCGRTRPYGIRRTIIRISKGLLRITLRFPAFFAKDREPAIANLVPQCFELLSIDLSADLPIFWIFAMLWFGEGSVICHCFYGR